MEVIYSAYKTVEQIDDFLLKHTRPKNCHERNEDEMQQRSLVNTGDIFLRWPRLTYHSSVQIKEEKNSEIDGFLIC